jgi:hypothetical protein
LEGSLLVTCKPNLKGGNFTITNGGELIDNNTPADKLHLDFNAESIRADKTIQTLEMIIGPEENYWLEELTAKMAGRNKPAGRKGAHHNATPNSPHD